MKRIYCELHMFDLHQNIYVVDTDTGAKDCVAMILARGTKLSIFDEPEAGIDLWSFTRLVETFQELNQEKKGTLLVISHQERILSIADEIVVIADGKVKQAGPREEILPQLLAQPHMACCPQGKVEVGYE